MTAAQTELSREPVLSAVLLAPRAVAELTGALAHLRAQTLRAGIEVVLVHTRAAAASIDRGAFDGFSGVRFVACDPLPTVAAGFTAGAAAASAEVVALVEDHVLLHPEWAAWTVEAHRQGCAAVAPLMFNANPATATSWANFLVSFLDGMAAGLPRQVDSGPGHNTSYKRRVLAAYGDELQTLYQSERTFHYRLRADGHVILAEPRARLSHLNLSLPRVALSHAFYGGALFGQYRVRGRPLLERVARTLAAPAVPLVRLRRMVRLMRDGRLAGAGMPRGAWAVVPLLLVAHAAGEAAGYWGAVRNIESKYEQFELHRLSCLRLEEQAIMLGTMRASGPPLAVLPR